MLARVNHKADECSSSEQGCGHKGYVYLEEMLLD